MMSNPIPKLFFSAIFILFMSFSEASNIPSKHNNTNVVIENHHIKMLLDCSSGAVIKSMSINNREVVSDTDGIYTSVTVAGKTFTSLHLLGKPVVMQSLSAVTVENISYGDGKLTVSETWTFTKTGNNILWNITRSFSNNAWLDVSASPVINFKNINTWDGAFQGYGGLAWFYLFNQKPESYGVHSRSSSFWTNKDKNGLDVTVTSPGNQVVMTYKRTKDDRLAYTISLSRKELLPLQDSGIHRRRFIRGDGQVWEPIAVSKGTQSQQITFTYVNTKEKYDRGKMPGVNGEQVSAVLNTIARIGVIDSLHYGGNSWATPYGPICLHEQYIGQLGLGINDPRYLKGYEACLDFYRDHAIKPDGRVWPRWAYDNGDAAPGQFNQYGFYEAQWGQLLDSNPDFVSNVSDLFDQTGDKTWVKGQQAACEKALDWILNRDSNHNGLVEMINGNQTEGKSSDWIDIVWASYENAFVNAKLYYALKKWAIVEQVLGNNSKAKHYAECAAKLKSSFNKPTTEGGFWDEEKKCYIHWRDNKNEIHGLNMVTPVNFMAITYGICDQPERQKAILDAIEAQMKQESLFFWPITMTSYASGELRSDQLPFPSYENGDLFLSWGSIGVAAYAKYDPAIALKYVKNVLQQYGKDGLAFQRYSRKDQSGQGDDILAGNSLSIVGLYQSIYGVNPLYNRLLLDPHLTPELDGTVLKYHYHDQLLTIKLDTGKYLVTDGKFVLSAKQAFGFSSSAQQLRYFNGNDGLPSLSIDHAGHTEVAVKSWTHQHKEWEVAIKKADKGQTTYSITQLVPNASYKLTVNGKTPRILRSNKKGEILISGIQPEPVQAFDLDKL
jgi:hypothetical protein